MAECQLELMEAGGAYPRTCGLCGLGKCQKGLEIGIKAAAATANGAEGLQSPMGWFYRVDGAGFGVSGNPSVYRCKLGSAWERMEVYDIGDLTSAELRFIADVIDASRSKAA